jgi:hypothetical protein
MGLPDDYFKLNDEEKLEFAIREMNKLYEIYEYWKQIAQNQRQTIENSRGITRRF